MSTITRGQFIDRLNNNWQPYLNRFQCLSPEAQSAFLQKQGYASFSQLLAHIIAWWQDGAQAIAQMQQNPALPLANYDVDDFNARAVSRFSAMDEASISQAFEMQRQTMLLLVSHLPDSQLAQENINTRLYYEIMAHWTEHPLE